MLITISPLIGSSGATSTPINYYFTWYDNTPPAGGSVTDFIIIQNLGVGDASVEVYLGGYGAIPCEAVTPGIQATITAPAEGGPLRITSISGQPLLVSRLVQHGTDFEQIYAVPESELDTQVLFPWYDQQTAGSTSSLTTANPGATDAAVSVYIADVFKGSFTLPAGSSQAHEYPGSIGSPVKVVSTNDQPIIASLRNMYNEKFSETAGTPVQDLSSDYFWTLYQGNSPENTWVLAYNPNPQPVFYEVKIAGTIKTSGTIGAGGFSTNNYPNVKDGPVELRAWSDSGHTIPANMLASQKVLQNGNFREEPGTPAAELSSYVNLAAHDENSGTLLNTSLYIANTGSAATEVYVYIENSGWNTSLTIAPNSLANPSMSESTGGAVRISSTNGQPIIASEIIAPPTISDPSNMHYFPWYDNLYGLTWVMMANPISSGGNTFDQYLQAEHLNSSPLTVDPGRAIPERFVDKFGGPLKVVTGNSNASLISERSLFGNSFEEIWATPYDELDSHYYWPWYDGNSMSDWVMVANPRENTDSVIVKAVLHIGDPSFPFPDPSQTKQLAPGESWPCAFNGWIGGMVEVTAWSANGSESNPTDARKVIASQRVLYHGAFNEMPGIPANNLSSAWGWTWYDDQSPGSRSWIVGGNPNAAPIYVGLIIGQASLGTVPHPINPGDSLPISVPGLMDGPVIIYGCYNKDDCANTPAPIIASQRSIWGNSFSEIAGEKGTDTKSTNAHWTWYDEKSPGSVDYVMISNLEAVKAYYEVKLAGALIGSGIIDPHSSAIPDFFNEMDGPLQVEAWISETDPNTGDQLRSTGADIMASQRVLWNGYFNEIFGKTL